MRSIIDKLRIQGEVFDTEDKLTEKNFYNTRFAEPDMLTETLTWLLGNRFKETPLSMMTIGAAITGVPGATQEINGFEYEFPIMGEIDRNEIISSSSYVPGDQPGKGHQTFKIMFQSNWFKRGFVLESPGEVQVRIDLDPKPVGDEFEYIVRLVSADANGFCPLSELEPGTMWTQMWSPHSQSGSQAPGFGNRVLPGKATNQLMLIRKSRQWGGNVANRAMNIQVPGPGGQMSEYLIDYDAWMFEREWAMEKETALWYSKYNKLPDGTIPLREVQNSDVIPQGAGLLEQIPNVFTYNTLTYNKLKSAIMDVYYGQTDGDAMQLTVVTGLGGLDEFDRAMKDYLVTNPIPGDVRNDKVVEGSGANMGINGFFTYAYFIGGYKITVVRNPVFDYGKRAVKSPKHPRTGYPLESYRMLFLDTNNYDGQPNIVYVYEKGRQRIDKHIAGMAQFPKGLPGAPDFVTSDKDASSTHRMGTCGIIMKRPSKSLQMICTAS